MKVHINELKTGSKKGYKVRWTAEGKPKEKFRKNYDDALALKIEIEETIFGDSEETYRKTFLTSEQLRDAEAAIVKIKGRLSLRDSARIALKHWVDKTNALSLKEAYWHYLEHIESKGLRAQTIGKYKQTALRLIDFFPEAQTIDLGYDTVEKFMSQFKHPSDFNNRRRELSNFLNFLKDKGWIKLNPFEQIKSKKVDTNPPEILSPTQVKELFKTAKQILPNECIAYLALSIFGAIRPEEMRRLSNKDNLKTIINLGTKMIKLPSNITKGRTPRNIIIRPALEAFLRAFPERPKMNDYNYKKLKKHLNFKIPYDGLRHTGITGIYNIFKNFGDTALETGNSESIIRKHYLGFWTEENSQEFWNIRPNKL
jgi:hypothetical protein